MQSGGPELAASRPVTPGPLFPPFGRWGLQHLLRWPPPCRIDAVAPSIA